MVTRLTILILMVFIASGAIAQIGFEQYCYITQKEIATPVSIINYESRENLYVEARYNYEALNAFSIYLGKSFSNSGKIKYSITPIMGVLMGTLKGGSTGFNAVVEYKKLFFSTQSQYTFSYFENRTDFLFAWSELGYQPCEWLFFGLSTQHTYMTHSKFWTSEPGAVLGFTIGKWTFPIYGFNLISEARYFVVGVNFRGKVFDRNRKQ